MCMRKEKTKAVRVKMPESNELSKSKFDFRKGEA